MASSSEIALRLANLLREILDLPQSTAAESITREAFPEWDSLRHVKLMLELQRQFGVRFSASEIICLASYAELLAELSRRKSEPKAE